jgi:hypothetical protein
MLLGKLTFIKVRIVKVNDEATIFAITTEINSSILAYLHRLLYKRKIEKERIAIIVIFNELFRYNEIYSDGIFASNLKSKEK